MVTLQVYNNENQLKDYRYYLPIYKCRKMSFVNAKELAFYVLFWTTAEFSIGANPELKIGIIPFQDPQ